MSYEKQIASCFNRADIPKYGHLIDIGEEADKELEAKDREITRVKVSRKAALSREVEANTNWSKEALKWAKELEANKKEIASLINAFRHFHVNNGVDDSLD